ncbi:MAG: Gfo/Idh/MocA family oxidoreductase [Oscillospiraceae bacterium]|nr:Gfo/Idh/MocA family oxidoreductase [Oscillospiraceae bacterium]
MEKKYTVVIIGAGNRGRAYGRAMKEMDDKYQVVAVADPIESCRSYLQEMFAIPEDRCFDSWESLLALGKIADIAVISTMDQLHLAPTLAATKLGYDILLEKPVAPNPVDCEKMAKCSEEMGNRILVCHVLRYTPFFCRVKQLLESGIIGKVISVEHKECVGLIHQSHSFVRGNWGNSGRSSCMLLQKSCHDLDILQWLLNKSCRKIQSFGTLTYFKEDNAPKDAPERCIDGCPYADTCLFNAVKLYLDDKKNAWFRNACTGMSNSTDEQVEKALRTTQYGKCVFRCDNDVVDHQTVNMLFEDDITVTFSMCAFNKGGRHIHIMGTEGELFGSMDSAEAPIRVRRFDQKEEQMFPITGKDGLLNGHGGGDEGIVRALHEYLSGTYNGFSVSDIRTSVNNHHLVFAAEQSRKNNCVVDLQEYIASL